MPEEKKVLGPLLALRQACCHPSIGAQGLKIAGSAGAAAAAPIAAQPPMTMAAVLEQLITDARVTAEDAQRVLLAALAGGAGVAVLRGDAASAARLYRRALAAAGANTASTGVRADPLQRLHLLVNLGRLVESGVVPFSMDDGDLATAASTIRDAYLADAAATLADKEAELDAALEGVRQAGVEDGAPRGGRRRRAPAAASPLVFDADAEHGDGWYLAALDTLASLLSRRRPSHRCPRQGRVVGGRPLPRARLTKRHLPRAPPRRWPPLPQAPCWPPTWTAWRPRGPPA